MDILKNKKKGVIDLREEGLQRGQQRGQEQIQQQIQQQQEQLLQQRRRFGTQEFGEGQSDGVQHVGQQSNVLYGKDLREGQSLGEFSFKKEGNQHESCGQNLQEEVTILKNEEEASGIGFEQFNGEQFTESNKSSAKQFNFIHPIAHSEVKNKKKFSLITKKHSDRYNIVGGVGLIIFVLGLFIFTGLTSIDIFFWTFFMSMFYWDIDSRVSIGGALVGLVLIMFLLLLNSWGWMSSGDVWAEKVAVGVYFFLVIGVVKQIWEYRTKAKIYKVKSL